MTVSAKLYRKKDHFTLDINLQLASNQVTAIFGPSGCGKTSLLRAIAGLDSCQGHLIVNQHIWQNATHQLPIHKRSVGMVFQEASLFNHLTVSGNLQYAQKRAPNTYNKKQQNGQTSLATPKPNTLQKFEQVIALFDLENLLHKKPLKLSGGERQRVAIARAVIMQPKLLLMDEPLASLDQARKDEILPYLEALNKQLTIPLLYVTHSLTEVSRLAEHLVLMDSGKVIASDTVENIFQRLDLPLAQANNASSLLTATVTGHDADYQLTYLDSAVGKITVPERTGNHGEEVRIQIAARDISITLKHQHDTSILNTFVCQIDTILPHLTDGSALLSLSTNGQKLLARITQKSVAQLALTTNSTVYAQAKSVALLK